MGANWPIGRCVSKAILWKAGAPLRSLSARPQIILYKEIFVGGTPTTAKEIINSGRFAFYFLHSCRDAPMHRETFMANGGFVLSEHTEQQDL